jgi:hypothetical protein
MKYVNITLTVLGQIEVSDNATTEEALQIIKEYVDNIELELSSATINDVEWECV